MDEIIKKAFDKVKEDINFLNNEILDIKIDLNEIKEALKNLTNILNNPKINEKNTSTYRQTLRHINSTQPVTSTHPSTVPLEVGGLKQPFLAISTGNQGVVYSFKSRNI